MKNISSGGARKYYESAQGEYYNKDSNTTEWQGQIAIDLGLAGKSVDFNDFENLAKGLDLSKQKLVKSAEGNTHRAGVDLTFSAPKSVSILSLVDPKILSAHQEAVKNTLNHIESNYIQTRVMVKGEKTVEDANKLIVAKFEHHANRNNEPQLHTHCVVMNLTKDSNDRYKTIHNDILYQDQKDLGQLYRLELAKNLVEKGYAIEITDQAQGFFKLQRVSDDIIKAFSTRSDEIGERANELKESHKKARQAKIKEMATLDTRTAKTNTLSSKEIREQVDKILEKHDTSLNTLANDINKASNEILPEKIDINTYIKEAILGIEENKSAWKRSEVLAHTARLAMGKASIDELDQGLKKYLNDNHIVLAGVKKCNKYYSTQEMKIVETNIVNLIKKGRDKSNIIMDQKNLEKFIVESTLNLTPGQKDALSLIATSKDKVIAIQGDAGTGKTFVMNVARDIFEKTGYAVKGFAPTGKAVQELAEGANIESRTISSYLLEHSSTDKKKDQPNSKDKNTSQEEEKPVPKGEIWIIDEAGMIGSKKIEQILALSNTNEIETKIVLVGDKKQFESIDQGKFFKDLQKSGNISIAEMKDNKRQKTEHTKEVVRCINNYIQEAEKNENKDKNGDKGPKKESEQNKYIEEAFTILKTSNSIYEYKDEEKKSRSDIFEKSRSEKHMAITSEYLSSIESGKSTLIITRTNDERKEINETIRDELKNKKTLSKAGSTFTVLSSVGLSGVKKMYAESYQEGNIVFFQHGLGDIARGTKGEIIGVDIAKNTIGVCYESDSKETGKKIKYVTLSLNSAKTANAIQVFTRENREFCVGDKIIFAKNDKRLNVKNGQIGTIEKIGPTGDCIVKIGEKQVEFNLKNQGKSPYPYIDHAYAITDYKSQGASVDTLIWSVRAGEANINSGYVALTRTKETIKIFTDSIDGLKQSIIQQSTKTSYLEFQNNKKQASKISDQVEKEIFRMPTLSNDFKELDSKITHSQEKEGYTR